MPELTDGLGKFIVFGIIVSIGMSLGGLTGYAINPARDLGPRLAHAVLPIKGKGSSNWGYGGRNVNRTGNWSCRCGIALWCHSVVE